MGLDRIGKYRILTRIGQGAMGEVYKAHDPLLNRYVAIKTIASAVGTDPQFRRRFQREAQAAAQLNHPHIITVFDFGEAEGITYMAMELLEGRDLKDVIAGGGLGSLRETLTVMQQVCDGVAFAHSKGVVHRDLKPGNIHIQPNGQVKVLDFGLARIETSDMTRTGTVMGTPYYMSPEQVRGEKASPRSDVFSLGSVFYEMLTGRRAFGDNPHQALVRILGEEPPPIRKLAPQTPDLVVAVVERALTKDTAGRYADGGAMAAMLRRVQQSLPPTLLFDEARAGADDAESTLTGAGEATITMGRTAGGAVAGATALDLRRASPASETAYLGTPRPGTTIIGASTQPAPSRGRVWLAAASVVLMAALGAGAWVWLHRPAPSPLGSADSAREHVGILTEALVTSQLELARTDMENRDYQAAEEHAGNALKYAPASTEANEEANEIRERAQRSLKDLHAAVEEARAAFKRGEYDAATAALGRVMSLDPRHPVVAELSGQLTKLSGQSAERFSEEAQKRRQEAQQARRSANDAQATAFEGYAAGARLEKEATALLQQAQYTSAAQKYVEARDAFDGSRRRAVEARTAPPSVTGASASRAAPSRVATASTPAAVPEASPSALPARPALPPVTPDRTLPPATTLAAAPSPASARTPSAAAGSPGDAAVLRVVRDYERAIETHDVALFRSLKPNMSSDEEKVLRDSFKQIKSWQVALADVQVAVDGSRATVRASRQDTVEGQHMPQREQTFHLVLDSGAWHIASLEFNR
jgi:eukaryotic-like serine/threonine-protein kinase